MPRVYLYGKRQLSQHKMGSSMAESIQQVLNRVRPPRVQITYDVEIGGAIEKKELPFIVGIIADLAAQSEKHKTRLRERKFVDIDRDNFDCVMEALEPRLSFQVPNALEEEGSGKIGVELFFRQMEDFAPIWIVHQVPPLKALYDERVALKDLTSKLDGNDALDEQLCRILMDQGTRSALIQEAHLSPEEETPAFDQLIVEAKLLKTPTPEGLVAGRRMLRAFFLFVEKEGDMEILDPYFFIMQCLTKIDRRLSSSLDHILHHPQFQKLEASWRGVHYLVHQTETSTSLKLRLLQMSYSEFSEDLLKAVEFDQSQLFKKIYEYEYGTFGGHPYSCIVLDFAFTRNPRDLDVLGKFAGVAAAAHVPTLAPASPSLFNLDSFSQIGAPRDLAKSFESTDAVAWNRFRDNPDSRYINLLLPHILMRPPYGQESCPVEEFNYEEFVDGESNDKFCWGNPAFALAERITHAFALYQWTASIRGVEGGGLVEGLPAYTFKTPRGDVELKCPTEVVITDRREQELSNLGFLALCHCKGTDYAAFFGGQSTQKPKRYNTDEANANALVSTRLPYMLNASRFAHYIKSIMRDKVGSFMSRDGVETFLQRWLSDYVLLSDAAPQEVKARYPLREGRVYVRDVPGRPGAYKAVIFLRPHFQLEELTVSLRLVADLPQAAA